MSADRGGKLTLNFTIVDGEIKFDVEHGDGSNCEALAAVFIQDNEVLDMGFKPEYNKAHSVSAKKRTQ